MFTCAAVTEVPDIRLASSPAKVAAARSATEAVPPQGQRGSPVSTSVSVSPSPSLSEYASASLSEYASAGLGFGVFRIGAARKEEDSGLENSGLEEKTGGQRPH
jgi:hypothetical protein